MLTQLSTLKNRLGIDDSDIKDDAILTRTINAISARFDMECKRTFARTMNDAHEFDPLDIEIAPRCYPIESVIRFELKTSEAEGWVAQTDVMFLLRRSCVIALVDRLGTAPQQARVIYTGGYVLPGSTVGAGQTALPADLETAAIEMVVFWYQNRDRVGVNRVWPRGGLFEEFQDIDLIPSVRAVLEKYERI
jgi:hypothetical protein